MYSSISTTELTELMGRANIIDIRDQYLYRLGNIPGSKNIPVNYLLLMPDKYLSKEKTYYIYCNMGVQSAKACNELAKSGYKVVNVMGGYNDYISR